MRENEGVTVRGWGRVQLVNQKTGKIEGDSGWKPNVITQIGFQNYITRLLGAVAGSVQATILALGTSSASPSSTQTSLGGEQTPRKTATASIVSSQTLRLTANWATDEVNGVQLASIGAYNTTSGGSVANALTFSASTKTTDQQLNATVEFRFS